MKDEVVHLKGKIWKKRKKIALLLTIALLTGAAPAAPEALFVSAAPSTQEQINQTEKEKEELENKQEKNENALEGLKGVQSDLKKSMEDLNSQLNEVVHCLEELEQQIRDKEQEIADTQAALEEAKDTEEWQYTCMVLRARAMYEYREENYLNELFSAGSLSEALNVANYIERVAASDRKLMDDYKANRILIEEHEARLQQEKIELDNLKVDAEAEKNKVSGLISTTANSIAATAEQIEEAEKKAREYEEELKKKEEDLEYLRKKLAEEIALSQAAANATWRDISEVSFAEGDRYLLANLIYCEAGGEPYAGQLAVGAVVINRVLSSKFPDSVVGVIYQKSQFSPVGSGRLQLALTANKATENCYRAADEAMSGITNVGNCVFFRTPIPGLTGISIGGHIFY
ncbi:MAG: cell wall hydrolase [Acetatifactor sp.]|nr:cell wall hydrolase [Acetatifactor sp.]